MWDVGDVGYSGGGMFGRWDVRDVGCSGGGMFGMWDVRDVGCALLAGMWDVDLQNALLEVLLKNVQPVLTTSVSCFFACFCILFQGMLYYCVV